MITFQRAASARPGGSVMPAAGASPYTSASRESPFGRATGSPAAYAAGAARPMTWGGAGGRPYGPEWPQPAASAELGIRGHSGQRFTQDQQDAMGANASAGMLQSLDSSAYDEFKRFERSAVQDGLWRDLWNNGGQPWTAAGNAARNAEQFQRYQQWESSGRPMTPGQSAAAARDEEYKASRLHQQATDPVRWILSQNPVSAQQARRYWEHIPSGMRPPWRMVMEALS